jgi:hypothetical protein
VAVDVHDTPRPWRAAIAIEIEPLVAAVLDERNVAIAIKGGAPRRSIEQLFLMGSRITRRQTS